MEQLPDIVSLNVGGHLFTTRLETLRKYPDSKLAAMFSGRHALDKDAQGQIFIDANGQNFSHVLEFLRDGSLPPQSAALGVYKTATHYGISELVTKLQDYSQVMEQVFEESRREEICRLFPNYEEFRNSVIDAIRSKMTPKLRARNYQMWMRRYDVESDVTFKQFIQKELGAYACVVVLFSKKSGDPKKDVDLVVDSNEAPPSDVVAFLAWELRRRGFEMETANYRDKSEGKKFWLEFR